MRLFFITILTLILMSQSFAADEIKLYDDYGNRIGTYRKEGNGYVLYDFFEKKIEQPQKYIKNSPTQKDLKEYNQIYEQTRTLPINRYSFDYIHKDNIFRKDYTLYECQYQKPSAYIVRPRNIEE